MGKERAALIALLRTTESGWPRLAAEAVESGSAPRLLDDAMGQQDTLFPSTARVEELIADAAEQLRDWERSDLGVHTVLDDTYPAQLREIREVPPVLLRRDTMPCRWGRRQRSPDQRE